MDLLQSVFIGAVQGVTEFLPISSSAHLVLIPYFFNWHYNGLIFDVALHFGTVLAIVAFFWRDWLSIFKSAFGRKNETQYPKSLLWQVIIATIPAGIAGYLLQNYVERYLHSPLLIALNLAIFGIVLWLVDRLAKTTEKESQISFSKSFLVGVAQCLALVPGVSRSGITIVASRLIGLPRAKAARFSFLLGTPAMLGAFLLEARKFDASEMNLAFVLSVIVSAIAGFIAIKYLLRYLEKGNFAIFAWYRFLIAAIAIAIFILR